MELLLSGVYIRKYNYNILVGLQVKKVHFDTREACKTTKYDANKMDKLRVSPDFDVKPKTVVIVGAYTQDLVKAYHSRGDVNVIVSLS